MAMKRISMRKIREIIRLKFELNFSHRNIAKSLSIGSSTVGDCLRRLNSIELCWKDALLFSEEDLEAVLFPPIQGKKDSQNPDWSYIHSELRHKGVTLQLLWEEYKASTLNALQYSRFCEKYKKFRQSTEYVFRNTHKGGEKLFVDYAGMTIPIIDSSNGETHNAQIFIATWGASNFTYAEASWSQKIPDWIASHQSAFKYFGGAPEILVPDNLKSGVNTPCRYDPDINPTYYEMARHYGSVVMPARVRKPKDKGKVENAVLVVERWILAALRNRQFFSIYELNLAIKELLLKLNARPFKKMKGNRKSHFENLDKSNLKPLPKCEFEFAEFKLAKVNIDYHIELLRHNYSVPFALVHKKVEVRYTNTTVEVLCNGKRVASHIRCHREGGYTTLQEHMPTHHKEYVSWTPERISRWAKQMGEQTQQVAEKVMESMVHPQQGFRSVLGIIRMGQTYGPERLEAACAKAMSIGSPSYRSIKSILKTNLECVPSTFSKSKNLPEHSNIRGREYYINQQT